MSTPVTNFAKGQVSGYYTAAAVTITLLTGHGSRFPATVPFPAIWWNATDYPDPADDPDREIVTVTNRVTDTFTLTRGAESTTITNKNIANKTYVLMQSVTAQMWRDLEARSLSQEFRGLTLQNHYDANKSNSRVVLIHADAIAMDDGQEVSDWNLVEADLTVSGAGGIDAGTEQNSTHYEVHAIYNGTTKSLILHRAKNYRLDQSFVANDDGAHTLRDNATRTKLAQGFSLTVAGAIETIEAKLFKVGAPTGQFWFTLEANSGGVPSGTPLATSDLYDVSRLGTTNSTSTPLTKVPFRIPASLSASTQYHLVLQGNFTISVTDYLGWRADTTTAGYANGSKAAYDGATWTTDTDDDFIFNLYVTENDVALTLPSGYTQSAKVGYAYNNASGNLKPFRQRQRQIFCGMSADWLMGSFSANPVLLDLSAFLPPTACRAVVTVSQITNSADVSLGPLNATDISGGLETVVGSVGLSPSAGQILSFPEFAFGPYQAAMFDSTATTPKLYLSSFEW